MKNLIISMMVALLAIGFFLMGVMYASPEEPKVVVVTAPPTPSPLDEDVLFAVVNRWRVDNGYDPYILKKELCDVADIRLKQIKTDWSHDQFVPVVKEYFGDNYRKIGENLARDYSEERDTLQGWLGSKTHRENLEDNYKYSCIKTDRYYAVQQFGNF